MNKQKTLKWLNLALFALFAVQAVTGALAFTGLLENAEAAGEVHEYAGLAMVLVVLAHLWLNWGWVKLNFLKKRG
ncbi:MAG: DUF4405 domain-containing protein [bacterium]|nr:DUF4405 domain-containing protein [bacterium]